MCNVDYKDKVYNLTLKLNNVEEDLKKSRKAVDDANTTYLNHFNSCDNNIERVDKE